MLAARRSASEFSRCPTIMPVLASGRQQLAGCGFCCRCRLPEALDYLARRSTSPPEPGSFVRVPLGERQLSRCRLGRGGRRASRGAAEADHRDFADAPAAAGVAPLCRARRRLHDGAARRGAAHDDERPRGVAAAAAAAALRGISDRASGARRGDNGNAPDPGATAGAGAVARRAAAVRPPSSRGSPGVAPVSSAILSPRGSSRSDSPRPRHPDRRRRIGACRGPALSPDQSVAAAAARRQRRGRRLSGDRARRRHRLGQDRDLFRRDRRGAGRRPAGAGAAAGDRARRTVARALPPALRGARRRSGIPT